MKKNLLIFIVLMLSTSFYQVSEPNDYDKPYYDRVDVAQKRAVTLPFLVPYYKPSENKQVVAVIHTRGLDSVMVIMKAECDKPSNTKRTGYLIKTE